MNEIDGIIHGMMTTNRPSKYWMNADIKFPELELSKSTMQRNNQSVWQHTMNVIDAIEKRNPITLLSGLFHDLGKCHVKYTSNTFKSKFPNHEAKSVIVAKNKLIEWGCSDQIMDGVIRIVSTHMYDISFSIQEKTMRNFIAGVGSWNINNWFTVRVADSKSYLRQPKYHRDYIEPFRIAVLSFLDKQSCDNRSELVDPGILGNMHIEGGDVQ